MARLTGRIGLLGLILSATVALAGCGDSGPSGDKADAGLEQDTLSADVANEDVTGADVTPGDITDTDSVGACSVGDACPRGMVCDEQTGTCGCGEEVCAEGTVCDAEAGLCEVEAADACETGAPLGVWEAGTQAFGDVSADWGLVESGANGQRISVADLDGDGWAELSVRAAGTTQATGGDDFSSDGSRRSWLFKNDEDGDGGRVFVDTTQASGLVATRDGADPDVGRRIDLVIWGDVNNDGFLDAYTAYDRGYANNDTAEIMLNNGDGTFDFGALDSASRNDGDPDSPGGASFVDFDRDGNLDLWVAQYVAGSSRLQDQLFKGDGTGSFVEVTDEAGLSTASWSNINTINAAGGHTAAWGAAACDLNGNGSPDLMASSYGRAPNHLWASARDDDGGVSFANESVASGYAFDERTDWSDNESARCYCKFNRSDEGCTGVPEPQYTRCDSPSDILRWDHQYDREPFRLGGNSGTTVCADINNDGWMDLLTTEIAHWDVGSSSDPSEILYNLQEDAPRFERPGNEATGLTREHNRVDWNEGDITAAVFDFDNDGRKDIYIGSTAYPGTRGLLWHQKADGTFESVSIEDGIDHKSSHGVGIADFDHDGDLDIVVGHSRSRCGSGDQCYAPENSHARLFENKVGQNNNWLQIALKGGEGSNRSAIGARVSVETDGMTQMSEVGGGHGHYGIQNELTQHFGLGAACEATVTVRWPDSELSEQTFILPAGHRYELTQGGVPQVVEQ